MTSINTNNESIRINMEDTMPTRKMEICDLADLIAKYHIRFADDRIYGGQSTRVWNTLMRINQFLNGDIAMRYISIPAVLNDGTYTIIRLATVDDYTVCWDEQEDHTKDGYNYITNPYPVNL